MQITFSCPCGNQDPKQTRFYDGGLGYEANACMQCGRVHNDQGSHEMSYDEALQFAISEVRSTPDADDLTLLQVAMKYAEFLDDDFNNASSALECELQDEFPNL